jgi:hypothetical protein
VAWQVGTAVAARTDYASLRSIGLLSKRFLQLGIAFELVFAAALIYIPALLPIVHTTALGPTELAVLASFRVIVWGADELRRYLRRCGTSGVLPSAPSPPGSA